MKVPNYPVRKAIGQHYFKVHIQDGNTLTIKADRVSFDGGAASFYIDDPTGIKLVVSYAPGAWFWLYQHEES